MFGISSTELVIAAAVTAIIVLRKSGALDADAPRQFSLRTLLIAVTAVAVILGWIVALK